MKFRFIFLIAVFAATYGEAQKIYVKQDKDSSEQASGSKPRLVNHYIGVQVNQLINQIFNFSGTTTITSNPYLLTWGFNSRTTGWGLNTGIGCSINSTAINSDPLVKQKQVLNSLSLRAGIEKKSYLSRKWMVSWGFDFLYGKSKTEIKSDNSGNTVDSNMTSSSSGFGPRVTLNYAITPSILMGTEATFYYTSTHETLKTEDSFSNTGTPIDNRITDFTVKAPIALFLTIKF